MAPTRFRRWSTRYGAAASCAPRSAPACIGPTLATLPPRLIAIHHHCEGSLRLSRVPFAAVAHCVCVARGKLDAARSTPLGLPAARPLDTFKVGGLPAVRHFLRTYARLTCTVSGQSCVCRTQAIRFRLFFGSHMERISLFHRSAILTHSVCATCDHLDARLYAPGTRTNTQLRTHEVRSFLALGLIWNRESMTYGGMHFLGTGKRTTFAFLRRPLRHSFARSYAAFLQGLNCHLRESRDLCAKRLLRATKSATEMSDCRIG